MLEQSKCELCHPIKNIPIIQAQENKYVNKLHIYLINQE